MFANLSLSDRNVDLEQLSLNFMETALGLHANTGQLHGSHRRTIRSIGRTGEQRCDLGERGEWIGTKGGLCARSSAAGVITKYTSVVRRAIRLSDKFNQKIFWAKFFERGWSASKYHNYIIQLQDPLIMV